MAQETQPAEKPGWLTRGWNSVTSTVSSAAMWAYNNPAKAALMTVGAIATAAAVVVAAPYVAAATVGLGVTYLGVGLTAGVVAAASYGAIYAAHKTGFAENHPGVMRGLYGLAAGSTLVAIAAFPPLAAAAPLATATVSTIGTFIAAGGAIDVGVTTLKDGVKAANLPEDVTSTLNAGLELSRAATGYTAARALAARSAQVIEEQAQRIAAETSKGIIGSARDVLAKGLDAAKVKFADTRALAGQMITPGGMQIAMPVLVEAAKDNVKKSVYKYAGYTADLATTGYAMYGAWVAGDAIREAARANVPKETHDPAGKVPTAAIKHDSDVVKKDVPRAHVQVPDL